MVLLDTRFAGSLFMNADSSVIEHDAMNVVFSFTKRREKSFWGGSWIKKDVGIDLIFGRGDE